MPYQQSTKIVSLRLTESRKTLNLCITIKPLILSALSFGHYSYENILAPLIFAFLLAELPV